ncbi:MAG: M23 family metallopeptidase [Synechococcaceae cyanobacterium]|nr:M23 family metallopeptidase [Synechococcaceae cyanobacterium]
MAAQPSSALSALAALLAAPLLGVPLVLAQTEAGPEAPQAAPSPAPAPPPALPPLPAASAPPPSPPQAPPTSVATPAPPLRYGMDEQRSRPPARFDRSLDALVEEGIVSPRERIRVRGTMEIPVGSRQELCSSGALSQAECNGGVVFRGRVPGGPTLRYLEDGQAGYPGGGMAAQAGERFGIDASPLPPISVPVSALLSGAGGSFRLTDVFRVTPRPAPIGGNNNLRLLYPLIGSSVTSSGFGWRLHPVLGSWLMHSGRDLAAPEGTPVVAALSGRVVSSGVAGGYGLAIEVEHDRPLRRTLYGHLSELYVKEGDRVRQGEVIGRVGSTGMSTGPHLHFELRLPQDGGWVATDPGDFDPGRALLAMPGGFNAGGDAVALLMGQLIQALERPRPVPQPRRPETAKPVAGTSQG